MTSLLPYITAGLRFAPDDTPCRPKDSLGRAFNCNYDGEGPAMAIHTWKGRHVCAYHSPFDNKYVPCAECGEKPTLMGGDGVCDDCLIAVNRVTEYDYYLAMTGAHDLRHPNRPAPADLPVSDYVDQHTKEEIGTGEAVGHVCDEEEERAAYSRYVDDGIADTDGWYMPIAFEAWRAHYHREIGYLEPRMEECTETECKAPGHERVKCVQDRIPGKGRPKYRSYGVCCDCYERRMVAYRAARAA